MSHEPKYDCKNAIVSQNADTEDAGYAEKTQRLRQLTSKGQELYENEKQIILVDLTEAWNGVDGCIFEANKCPSDVCILRKVEKELVKYVATYRMQSDRYSTFLKRHRTEDSMQMAAQHSSLSKMHEDRIQSAIKGIDDRIQEHLEITSQKSKSTRSGRSSSSTLSIIIAKKRAEADRAREAIKYAQKEAGLRRQHALLEEEECFAAARSARKKTEINTDMTLLEHEKEAALAEAEVRALQFVDEYTDSHSSRSVHNPLHLPAEDPMARTQHYVEEYAHSAKSRLVTPSGVQLDPNAQDYQPMPQFDKKNSTSENKSTNDPKESLPDATPQMASASLNQVQGLGDNYQRDQTNDLSRFMLKKELLFSRLTKYDDHPESYAVWRSGFRNIMKDLQVSVEEEFDLLSKWLGNESAKNARSLRSANINNPRRGLELLWERLDERYGCPELVETSIKMRLESFPKLSIKDNKQLYDLSDIVSEIESMKEDSKYQNLLAYFDSSSGVNPIVSKLPYQLQEKWTNKALEYKRKFGVSYPPFPFFAKFLRQISKDRNDPSFLYEQSSKDTRANPLGKTQNQKLTVSTRKTDIDEASEDTRSKELRTDLGSYCPLHKTRHSLNECKAFRKKPIDERKRMIKEERICFRCCATRQHIARFCESSEPCGECNSRYHATALHIDSDTSNNTAERGNGGETKTKEECQSPSVESKCTEICSTQFGGKSCSKTVLVKVYPSGQPAKFQLMYAILDDQSNVSLAKSEMFDSLGIEGAGICYTLTSCAGQVEMIGRVASNLVIESMNGETKLDLPQLLECNEIPNQRNEIATPEIAQCYPHLQDIAGDIPPLDSRAEIQLLIGRDLIEAHHVLDQRIGPQHSPYAQKLKLGWVIIGETCLGKIHQTDNINVLKTTLLPNGRTTLFKPCTNGFTVDKPGQATAQKQQVSPDEFGSNIFQINKDDNKEGLSIDDQTFLKLMDKNCIRNAQGNWEAPLPFRSDRPRLPNNRTDAIKRAQVLERSLRKNERKRDDFISFMDKLIQNNHAELAPHLSKDEENWYLPIFSVYHPKKPNQIRVVFDSSSKTDGLSLNDVLLRGPCLTNNLLGVLLRFRREQTAIIADIQQMFYCFNVMEDHRKYLQFLWYRDNDLANELVDYRMRVHVFGNSPSPAVATYALRRAAETGLPKEDPDVKEFVNNNFYVDDGLASYQSSEEAINILKKTQQSLKNGGNLRLHKIASNSADVMEAFDAEDLAKDIKDLSFEDDSLPTQRSLGLSWNLQTDCFTFQICSESRPYTRRGILSTINSIFDPIGFAAPVIIKGKLLLRDVMAESAEWDKPLSEARRIEWESWEDSLKLLEQLNIQRAYTKSSTQAACKKELLVFSDASEKAIAAVVYLNLLHKDGTSQLGFVLGKAKVAPTSGHTIPRKELCAAVLAVELSEFAMEQLNVDIDCVRFYTDSKIVLGYINNNSRWFYMYVSNRIEVIRRYSKPEQWHYVRSECNPADQGTRSLAADQLQESHWLCGPTSLPKTCELPEDAYTIQTDDTEVRPDGKILVTSISQTTGIGTSRFERFSSWKRLIGAACSLRHIVQSFKRRNTCKGWHTCSQYKTLDDLNESELWVIRQVQQEMYGKDIKAIQEKRSLPKESNILSLMPIIDDKGIVRVGGRLTRSNLREQERSPIIIPGRHHIAKLIVWHIHESVYHQGRHITEGAVREAGFWITGVKRLIRSLLHHCVKCRKQRGKLLNQKMADLPADRITPGSPFSNVGVDAFGPWTIVTRRTRGGCANSKRWAILFSCLTTRAVHIEVIEEMTSSSFINALRRFIAVRGKVDLFCSDRGSNFVGAVDDLMVDVVNVEDTPLKSFLQSNKTKWVFNPPHSSHMGGSWERMIGLTRRILDNVMTSVSPRNLTHEVLTTFMAEAMAIINSRPLVPVSSDSDVPFILTPATLLTQKTANAAQFCGTIDTKNLYKAQWRQVQALADAFWNRWQKEYLQNLQTRRKWHTQYRNVTKGDIVLLCEEGSHRNDWPVGIILNSLPGEDGLVRKVEVRVMKNEKPCVYTRPVTKLIQLIENDD